MLYNETKEDQVFPGQEPIESSSGTSQSGLKTESPSVYTPTPKPTSIAERPTFFGNTVFTGGYVRSSNFVSGTSGWEWTPTQINIYTGVFNLGGTTITINNTEDIQTNINTISAAGGGTLYLSSGTYNLTSSIDIPSNVYLIGASRSAVILDFGGGAFQVKSIGSVLGPHRVNVLVKDLTIQNSSVSGLKFQYNDFSAIDGVDVYDCNIGIELDVVDSVIISGMGTLCDLNGTGIKISNSTSFSIYFSACTNSTSGHGLELVSSSSATIFDSAFSDNNADGINITSCSNIAFMSLAVDGNGGQGIELVSGNSNLQFVAANTNGNTSDGYKFTATSDGCIISGCSNISNGGWGINIAASTCDNNIIITPYYSGNSSGTLTDSGTGTMINGDDTAYASSWNGNVGTPTKNAVYDKIETLGTTPKMRIGSDCSSTSRSTSQSAGGAGGISVNTLGLTAATSASANSYIKGKFHLIGGTTTSTMDAFAGTPMFGISVHLTTLNTTTDKGQLVMMLGDIASVAGTGFTFTNNHIGFKILESGGVFSLYATQADGSTENASSALTTVVAGDMLELICKVNASSVDYYWRKTGGSLSSATNLTSNMPATTTDENAIIWGASNKDEAAAVTIAASAIFYER